MQADPVKLSFSNFRLLWTSLVGRIRSNDLPLFAVLFPIWFFRYSKSLWLALDYLVDAPRE